MKENHGLRDLIKEGRRKFRRDENRLYYTEKDYRKAERKYLKECVIRGRCS